MPQATHLSVWTPEPSLTTPSGSPITPDMVFFVAPPEGIGPLNAARSTLKPTAKPMPMAVRWLLTILGTVAVFAAFYMALSTTSWSPVTRCGLDLLAALICFVVVWNRTDFKPACEFVGELGLARISMQRSPTPPFKQEVHLFQDFEDLKVSQTRNYHNGIYTHTNYSFSWLKGGKQVFGAFGDFRNKESNPPPTDNFWFYKACEHAWNAYILQTRIAPQLEQQGYVEFNVNKDDWVRVAPDSLHFHFKNRDDQIAKSEIKSIDIKNGTFVVKHADAKWYSNAGKFSFNYSTLANAGLFVFVLERVLGWSFHE